MNLDGWLLEVGSLCCLYVVLVPSRYPDSNGINAYAFDERRNCSLATTEVPQTCHLCLVHHKATSCLPILLGALSFATKDTAYSHPPPPFLFVYAIVQFGALLPLISINLTPSLSVHLVGSCMISSFVISA